MLARLISLFLIVALLSSPFATVSVVAQEELNEKDVLEAIRLSRDALAAFQLPDGSWDSSGHEQFGVGVTALVTLALLNSGMQPSDPPVQRALTWMRSQDEPAMTYSASLALMVYAMARDPKDRIRMRSLASHLENGMTRVGTMKGCWNYSLSKDGPGAGLPEDHSNGQFAALALFEAAQAGVNVQRETWELIRDHWIRTQNPDGGWGYHANDNKSTGSMTVAGIAVMVMASAMLREDGPLDADGKPDCCTPVPPDETLERGVRWLTNRFSVGTNPASGINSFYYLYGLERAGRLSGRRFFGDHDWYREGTRFLVRGINKRTQTWQSDEGSHERNPIIATSFSLLFLSKGLAPVLINKLQFPTTAGDEHGWNRHPDDIRNLNDRLSGSEGWPKLMTWQVVDLKAVRERGNVSDLNQASVLYLSASDTPEIQEADVALLREYISLGGFILAVNNCSGDKLTGGMRDLLKRMYPAGDVALERLKPDHPVFRSENLLDGETIELLGADFGCRTAVIVVPEDLACFWQRWGRLEPPKRPDALKTRIERAMRIGTNIVAYASGREPLNKLERDRLAVQKDQVVTVKRGLIQIAQIRHTGGWDTAPSAAKNLLMALNRTVGLTASTEPAAIVPTDPSLLDYSMAVMHGRQRFSMTPEEVDRLRTYLQRGRLLYADACCGSVQFDQSFRQLVRQLFPDQKLERIPANDPLFTLETGHDVRQVKRRVSEQIGQSPISAGVVTGEPFLEGIRINDRWGIIYSKYDISCALERQASVACAGYLADDAVKLSVNVMQYALTAGTK